MRASLAAAMALSLIGAGAGPAGGQEAQTVEAGSPLVLAAGGTLKLEGTSTLHPWSSSTKELRGRFRLKAGATPGDPAALLRSGAVESFELRLPVRSLRSGEGGLDDNLYKALRAEQNADVVFQTSAYQVTPTSAGAFKATLRGALKIAGVAREVAVDVEAQPTAHGLRVTGSKVLSMEDYDVKPPVLLFGMIKTGDAVSVRFDVEVVAAAGPHG